MVLLHPTETWRNRANFNGNFELLKIRTTSVIFSTIIFLWFFRDFENRSFSLSVANYHCICVYHSIDGIEMQGATINRRIILASDRKVRWKCPRKSKDSMGTGKIRNDVCFVSLFRYRLSRSCIVQQPLSVISAMQKGRGKRQIEWII